MSTPFLRLKTSALAAALLFALPACDSDSSGPGTGGSEEEEREEVALFRAQITQAGSPSVEFDGNYIFHHPTSSTISNYESGDSGEWSFEREADGVSLTVFVDDEGEDGVLVQLLVDGEVVRSEDVEPGGGLAIDYYLDD